ASIGAADGGRPVKVAIACLEQGHGALTINAVGEESMQKRISHSIGIDLKDSADAVGAALDGGAVKRAVFADHNSGVRPATLGQFRTERKNCLVIRRGVRSAAGEQGGKQKAES